MKKILIGLLLCISIVCSAETYNFMASAINVRIPPTQWAGWRETNLSASWNLDNQQIIIFTEDAQIFDYITMLAFEGKDYTVYKAVATDTQYETIKLEIYVYKSGDNYIKILYPYLEYKYKLIYIRTSE